MSQPKNDAKKKIASCIKDKSARAELNPPKSAPSKYAFAFCFARQINFLLKLSEESIFCIVAFKTNTSTTSLFSLRFTRTNTNV